MPYHQGSQQHQKTTHLKTGFRFGTSNQNSKPGLLGNRTHISLNHQNRLSQEGTGPTSPQAVPFHPCSLRTLDQGPKSTQSRVRSTFTWPRFMYTSFDFRFQNPPIFLFSFRKSLILNLDKSFKRFNFVRQLDIRSLIEENTFSFLFEHPINNIQANKLNVITSIKM